MGQLWKVVGGRFGGALFALTLSASNGTSEAGISVERAADDLALPANQSIGASALTIAQAPAGTMGSSTGAEARKDAAGRKPVSTPSGASQARPTRESVPAPIAFEYTFVGRIGLDGGEATSVILLKDGETRVAVAGRALDDVFAVTAVKPDRLELVHIPSGRKFSKTFAELTARRDAGHGAGSPGVPESGAEIRQPPAVFVPPLMGDQPTPSMSVQDQATGEAGPAVFVAPPSNDRSQQPAFNPATTAGPPPARAGTPESPVGQMRPVDPNAVGVPGAFMNIPPPPPGLFPGGAASPNPASNVLKDPAAVGNRAGDQTR